MSRYELPINIEKGLYAYLHLTLPFTVIRIVPSLQPWIYENFINIHCHEDAIMYTKYYFEFIGKELFIFTEMRNDTCDYDDIQIVEYIKKQIAESRNYIYVWLDEYYLSCQNAYGQYNYRHPSLIYGYDEETNEFLTYSIDKNYLFTRMRYGFSEVEKAFHSAKNFSLPEDVNLMVFKPKDFGYAYPFSLDKFLQELIDYTCSNNKFRDNYFELRPIYQHNPDIAYGMDVYKRLISLYKNKQYLDGTDINNIHFLYEHKVGLMERLEYIRDIFDMDKLIPLIKDFEEVVNGFLVIRNTYLKSRTVLENESKNEAKLKDFKNRTIDNIIKFSERERELLLKIIVVIKHYFKQQIIFNELSHETVKSEMQTNTQDCAYKYHLKVKIHIDKNQFINRLELLSPPNCMIELLSDGTTVCTMIFHENNLSEYSTFKLNLVVKEAITLNVYSDIVIQYEDLMICLYKENLTKGKQVKASSHWKDINPEIEKQCLPKNATDGNNYTFWNAAKDWNFGEYFRSDFPRTHRT